jgi:hypothetical protein
LIVLDRPAHLPNLAASLDTLAEALAGVGRSGEALAAARGAVELFRELLEAEGEVRSPDQTISTAVPDRRLAAALWRQTMLEQIHEPPA